MATGPLIHIIGASGRSGEAVARVLGCRVVPVVRDQKKWAGLGLPGVPRVADLMDAVALTSALRDASHIVSCAHARHTASILRAAPRTAKLVLLGSTRKFTRWPDAHGNGVLAGEAAFLSSDRSGVMLHPTMIYGAQGEDNVRRLAALMRRLPVLPLPEGGRSLVQPIHQSDVTRAILAALRHDWSGPETMVIAGPAAVTYRQFAEAVAAAAGIAKPRVMSVPAGPLIAFAGLTTVVRLFPTISGAEIRRLLEDKSFDIGAMRSVLGVASIPLAEGLALTFDRNHGSGD